MTTDTLTTILFLAALAAFLLGGAAISIKTYENWQHTRDLRRDEWWRK